MYILLAIVLLFPIAFYIGYRWLFIKRRHQTSINAVEAAYKRVVKRYKLTISEVNKFVDRIIAIDRNKAKLVMIIFKQGVTWEKCLPIAEIKNAVVKGAHHANGSPRAATMELSLRNSSEVIRFPFFQKQLDDVRLTAQRMKQSKYWQRKILRYIDTAAAMHRTANLKTVKSIKRHDKSILV